MKVSEEVIQIEVRGANVMKLVASAVSVCIFAVAGCGGPPYEVAEVNGTVTVNGRPGHQIRVEFHPDPGRGTTGPMSTADTDAEGKFTLQLMEGSGQPSRPGAVVGWHRIVLSDLQLAASATGRGVPRRVRDDYTLIGSTKLTREVTAEAGQNVTLQITYP